tara:strand:- start:1714 stop:4635 length:2922 start_codon:yes stop_codon:yes gene_type:complete
MTIIDQYFEYFKKYSKKYGVKTAVLLESGSFFEIYGVDNLKEKIGNIKDITDILNITLSRKNKNILENNRKNSLMAGFPTGALSKFLPVLLSNKYTVVLIEQITPAPNPIREVTRILSPGTYINHIVNKDENNISSIYIEESITSAGKLNLLLGISTIDVSTGKCNVYEIINSPEYVYENMFQYIESNNPKELIIINGSSKINSMFPHRTIYNVECDKAKHKINYINSFLNKVYTDSGMLSGLEFIDLERQLYAAKSFIYLLNFAYEHNEKIIEKINKPDIWLSSDHLTLYNNTLYQLNIIGNDSNNLVSILDKTSTNMGKRLLRKHIVKPLLSNLSKYYDRIEQFIPYIKELESSLNNISDIERLSRKISLLTINPHEMYNFYLSLEYCKDLEKTCNTCNTCNASNASNAIYKFKNKSFNKLLKYCKDTFNFEKLSKYTLNQITESIFNPTIFPEVDNIQLEINEIFDYFKNDINELSLKIDEDYDSDIDTYIRLDFTERDGYFYITTKKRYKYIESDCYILKQQGSNVKIFSGKISKKSEKLTCLREKIKVINKECFIKTLEHIYSVFNVFIMDLIDDVSMIDYIKSNAKCAIEFNYKRPVIDESSDLIMKGLRHPIIERLQSGIEYIKNDIDFNKTGILLFGLNGVGKSSLMKAVGLSVIMAQAGMFVPCDSMIFKPFTKIFSRITGTDDIFKGQSSFTVEMEELRAILKYSDENSLVLGDEICRGTETISGLSIVTASVSELSKKKSKFIFATHLHKLEELVEDSNIKFCHLHVDVNNDEMIYHRKIKDGIGSSLYGLEVAKYLLDNDEFINNAFKIRNKIINKSNDLLSTKKSKYNSKLYMDKCQMCGSNECLDTHHIKFQELSDKNNYIEHIHQNDLSNLIALCKKCHNNLHKGEFNIEGYLFTNKGLKVKKNKIVSKRIKKYNEDQINIINSLKNNSIKYVIETLKTIHDIRISTPTIKKIWNGDY